MKKTFLLVLFVFLILAEGARASFNEIDVNKASLEDLQKIVGIGPVLAERIKAERPFLSLDDLLKVRGIGEITLDNIKKQGIASIDVLEKEKEIEEYDKKENTVENKKIYIKRKNPIFLFLSAVIVSIISFLIIILFKKSIKKL